MKIPILITVFLSFVSNSSFSKNKKILTFATIEWPPYVSKKLKSHGWTSQVIKSAFKSQGKKVKFYFVKGKSPWGGVLKHLKKGRFVAGFPAYFSKEREASYLYSKTFGNSPLSFYKRKEKKVHYNGDLQNLKKFSIGVIKDYIHGPNFDNATFLNKKYYKTDRTGLVYLYKKRVDLLVLDKFVTQYYLKFDPYLKEIKSKINFLEPPLANKTLHIIFSKERKESERLRIIFHKGLDAIKKTGEYRQILLQNNKL